MSLSDGEQVSVPYRRSWIRHPSSFPSLRPLWQDFQETVRPCKVIQEPLWLGWKQCFGLRHLKSHLGIKSHSCSECGESFVDGTRLKQHRWIHLQHRAYRYDSWKLFGPVIVHQCDMYFLDLNYRCPAPGCKEAFRHKGHLKSHTASFHPEVVMHDTCDIYVIVKSMASQLASP